MVSTSQTYLFKRFCDIRGLLFSPNIHKLAQFLGIRSFFLTNQATDSPATPAPGTISRSVWRRAGFVLSWLPEVALALDVGGPNPKRMPDICHKCQHFVVVVGVRDVGGGHDEYVFTDNAKVTQTYAESKHRTSDFTIFLTCFVFFSRIITDFLKKAVTLCSLCHYP